MELVSQISHVLTAIIAVMAVLTGLGFIFNMLLNPLKESHVQIKKDFEKMRREVSEVHKEMREDFKVLDSKINQLLLKNT